MQALFAITVIPEISIGDIVIGAGTLLLALVTFLLARSTSKSVEALDLPFVIATPERGDGAFWLAPTGPPGEPPTDAEWALSVDLSNQGAGPGITEKIDMRHAESGEYLTAGAWEVDEVLAKGETKAVGIPLNEDPPSKDTWLDLDIYYRAASGTSYVTEHQIRVLRNMGASRRSFKRVKLGRWQRRRRLKRNRPTD